MSKHVETKEFTMSCFLYRVFNFADTFQGKQLVASFSLDCYIFIEIFNVIMSSGKKMHE